MPLRGRRPPETASPAHCGRASTTRCCNSNAEDSADRREAEEQRVAHCSAQTNSRQLAGRPRHGAAWLQTPRTRTFEVDGSAHLPSVRSCVRRRGFDAGALAPRAQHQQLECIELHRLSAKRRRRIRRQTIVTRVARQASSGERREPSFALVVTSKSSAARGVSAETSLDTALQRYAVSRNALSGALRWRRARGV